MVDRSKQGRAARVKGKAGACEVAKIFQETFGGVWERTKDGVPGPDITTPDSFKFCIEVKHDKSINAIHLFKGSAKLDQYWQQACKQATDAGKQPLLVCKVQGVWVALDPYGEWLRLARWLELH